MPDALIWSAYLFVGMFAGLAGGLGLGGGIFIVPALLTLFTWQGFPADMLMHFAVATSLSTIIFTSISASYAHHRNQTILWVQVRRLVPGIIIGTIFGAWIAHYLSSMVLSKVFGIFEIFAAYRIAGFKESSPKMIALHPSGMLLTGGVIGTVSSLLGIGGGTLTVPFLTWCQIDIRKAIGSACACSLPIALGGTLAMIFTGLNHPNLPPDNIGYVHWPATLAIFTTSIFFAPLGAKLTNTVARDTLKRFLAIILLLVGLRMLF